MKTEKNNNKKTIAYKWNDIVEKQNKNEKSNKRGIRNEMNNTKIPI